MLVCYFGSGSVLLRPKSRVVPRSMRSLSAPWSLPDGTLRAVNERGRW